MFKIPDPTPHLDAESQKIYNEICAERSNRYPGLFNVLMHCPNIAKKFADLKETALNEEIIPATYREFAILTLAERLKSGYIATIRIEPAKNAGLSDTLIERIFQGQKHYSDDALYDSIVELVDTLLNFQSIPSSLQAKLVEELDHSGLIQLTTLIGIYQLIAMQASAFEFEIPEGLKNPFK